MTTIVTLRVDEVAQGRFEGLRRAHYPSGLNRIEAHLTLFHALPGTEEVRGILREVAGEFGVMRLRVGGVMSLGRGVALRVEGAELPAMRKRLVTEIDARLGRDVITAQDRQGFRPHVVVQNKVSGVEARALFEEMSAGFVGWEADGVGLDWWEYLGGVWGFLEGFGFSSD